MRICFLQFTMFKEDNFNYSKYRTEVLSNSFNKDNLILTKVLSSMPLYKQEEIYELKKQGLKNFAEIQFKKVRIKKQEQPILKCISDYSVEDQAKIETSIIYSDSEIITKSGLRMRSPDETLTFLKNNFGVVVRSPQKQRLRSRKEFEEEEKQIERYRIKQYNVKDKLELYYTNLDTQVQSNKKNEELMKMTQNIQI
ncbi:unnamed protein product [Paramecium sonneborni]|uniref:Uncharacterized protein n=1 Tax=Paramecium sonneborni TaxID=65129 RepID=A0A8S1L8A4_9CILI|nr:unnamed protein product [Paramecium sonneborni]